MYCGKPSGNKKARESGLFGITYFSRREIDP
jgi:hypothetical protein